MATCCKKHMTLYFLHVLYSDKTLHKEAYDLTQLAPIGDRCFLRVIN